MKKLSALLLVIGFLFAVACASRNLTFTTGSCLQGIDPYSNPRGEILSVKKQENNMTVRGYVKTYCAGAEIEGSYRLQGQTIILSWSVDTSGGISRCLCAHSVTWKIDKLPPGNYTVKLAE